jgi:hypothetical protein
MQLHEVDVVKELFTVAEVNKALQDGWRIVAVVSSAEPGTGELAPVACYVMGRKNLSPMDKAIAAAQGKVLQPVVE